MSTFLSEFLEPKRVVLNNPRVIRGYGNLYVVLADDDSSRKSYIAYHGMAHAEVRKHTPATVPMGWFDNLTDANDYVCSTFNTKGSGGYFRSCEAKVYLYIRPPHKPRVKRSRPAA